MIKNIFLFLMIVSSAIAGSPMPPDTALTFKIRLFDGASMLTGKTVTGVLTREDGKYWNSSGGGSWQVSRTTVTLTEVTGDASRVGYYTFTLSQAGASTTGNTFTLDTAYTNGSDILYNSDTISTRVPAIGTSGTIATVEYVSGDVGGDVAGDIRGAVLDTSTVWQAQTSTMTVAGSVGKLIATNVDAKIREAGGGSAADVWNEPLSSYTTKGTAGWTLSYIYKLLQGK